jgi:hypothetical protein
MNEARTFVIGALSVSLAASLLHIHELRSQLVELSTDTASLVLASEDCRRALSTISDEREAEIKRSCPLPSSRLDAIDHKLADLDAKVTELVGDDEPEKLSCVDGP